MAYTQQEETEIVRDAEILTSMIESETKKLAEWKQTTCDIKKPVESKIPTPPKPERTVLNVPQTKVTMPPDPVVSYKFNFFPLVIILGAAAVVAFILQFIIYKAFALFAIICVLCIWGLIGYVVYGLIKTHSEKKKLLAAKKQSPEYLQLVENAKKQAQEQQAAIDADFADQQKVKDEEFAAALAVYENETMPAYQEQVEEAKQLYLQKLAKAESDIARWEKEKATFIEWLEKDLLKNETTLGNLYANTRLIPPHCQNMQSLEYLYNTMSTTDISFDRAVDFHDRQKQLDATLIASKQVTESIQNMNATMMSGFDYVYNAICDGNDQLASMEDVLSNMDSTLTKTRRDMNIGNAANIYQRYKYRKEDKKEKK